MQEFSFSTWVKLNDSIQTIGNIFRNHWNDGHWLRFEPFGGNSNVSTSLAFNINTSISTGGQIHTNTQLNLDQWYHVTCTYDGMTSKIYIDGNLITQANINGVITNYYNDNFYLGAANSGVFTEYFNGNIKSTSIWSKALTHQEIQDYMNCSPTGSEAGLIGYWNFEEGTGSIAFDQTPNGNNGTINQILFCAKTISVRFNDPTHKRTLIIIIPIETS